MARQVGAFRERVIDAFLILSRSRTDNYSSTLHGYRKTTSFFLYVIRLWVMNNKRQKNIKTCTIPSFFSSPKIQQSTSHDPVRPLCSASGARKENSGRRRSLLGGGVLLGSVDEEVNDTVGVTPLVVVPGDELDEVLVELDTSGGVEDGGSSVADEVGRDDRVLSVLDDALVFALSGFLQRSLDVIVRSGLLETSDKIDNGDVVGGDTERKTAV